MCGLWAGLVLTGVSPFMLQLQADWTFSTFFFFFFFFRLILHRLYFCGWRVPSFAIWQSDRNKFTNKKKTGLRTQQSWQKKSSGSGYVLEIARSPLVFFQAMISNLRHQKSLKKVKKCKKVKVKAFFSSVVKQAKIAAPYLTDGLKSRVRHWLNRSLRLSLGISPALSFFRKMLS